ncbi:MAG: ABC transporter substrate-binding protein [Proteobacteria bacterium]|nr:ABC transporter substrate-binding protein [Pseudomonadota bacterium]MBU1716858.1 ABC transporter substrate-binding protein [Pseudomonadota bacterium]
MRTRFILLLFSFISFGVCLVAGCQNKQAKPLPVIRVGHAPHDHHSSLYIAASNPEYFQQNGGIHLKEVLPKKEYTLIANNKPVARVLIDSSTGGNELIRKLAEDQFDMAFGGVPAMIEFIDNGSCLKIAAPIMTEGSGLVLSNKIPAANWSEFVDYASKQKNQIRIGYKIDVSVQNLIFEYALREVGLSYSNKLDDTKAQILLVNLHGAKNLIPALKNKIIDGFVINQPFAALAEHQGVGKTIASLSTLPPKGKWEGNPCCALAVCSKFAAAAPDITEKFITLMLRANHFIIKNPEKSANQIAQWLGIPQEVEQKSIPTIKFSTSFDQKWDQGINFWIENMIRDGKLKGPVKEAYEKGDIKSTIYTLGLYQRVQKEIK